MSDIAIIKALLLQHCEYRDPLTRMAKYITDASAQTAAEALAAAGFRMGADKIDADQNARLEAMERRLDHLEGFLGPKGWVL